jgi:hypothetical protein
MRLVLHLPIPAIAWSFVSDQRDLDSETVRQRDRVERDRESRDAQREDEKRVDILR